MSKTLEDYLKVAKEMITNELEEYKQREITRLLIEKNKYLDKVKEIEEKMEKVISLKKLRYD